jgi:hypothetical protein
MRASSSPSGSSTPSTTIAPCRSSITASQPFATASTIGAQIASKRLAIDEAARHGVGRDRHGDVPAFGTRQVEERGDRVVGAGDHRDRLVAERGPRAELPRPKLASGVAQRRETYWSRASSSQ